MQLRMILERRSDTSPVATVQLQRLPFRLIATTWRNVRNDRSPVKAWKKE